MSVTGQHNMFSTKDHSSQVGSWRLEWGLGTEEWMQGRMVIDDGPEGVKEPMEWDSGWGTSRWASTSSPPFLYWGRRRNWMRGFEPWDKREKKGLHMSIYVSAGNWIRTKRGLAPEFKLSWLYLVLKSENMHIFVRASKFWQQVMLESRACMQSESERAKYIWIT